MMIYGVDSKSCTPTMPRACASSQARRSSLGASRCLPSATSSQRTVELAHLYANHLRPPRFSTELLAASPYSLCGVRIVQEASDRFGEGAGVANGHDHVA